MNDILKFIVISILIISIIFLIPIYTLYDTFKTPSFDVGTPSYEVNQKLERIVTSDIDQSLKKDLQDVMSINSKLTRDNLISFFSISIYYVVIISISLLISGIYMLKKNIKVVASSFIFCSILSLIILALTSYITYISYLC